MKYYLADNGQQRGPFEVQELVTQGMRGDSLVWADGMPQWQQADQVPALRDVLAWSGQTAPPLHANQPYAAATPSPPGYSAPMGYSAYHGPATGHPPYVPGDSKRIAAGICAILLGGLGIHKFILGFNTAGVIYLLVSILGGVITCFASTAVMGIIALIEGIIYLTKTDEQFYWEYTVGKKQWF